MRRFLRAAACAGWALLAALPVDRAAWAQGSGGDAGAGLTEDPKPMFGQLHIPGTDGPEAAVREAVLYLLKGQAELLPAALRQRRHFAQRVNTDAYQAALTELGRRKMRILKAEQAYRAAVSKAIFDLIMAAPPNKRWAVAQNAFATTRQERVWADTQAGIRLEKYLKLTPGAFERWTGLGPSGLDEAIAARIEVQLRLTRLRESAAHEILTTMQPIACVRQQDNVSNAMMSDPVYATSQRVLNAIGARCVSRTIYWLAELSERIAASLPDGYVPNQEESAAELSTATAREMAAIRNGLDMQEFLRVASTGYVVDPENGRPIGGILRLRIARNAERGLVQFLDRIGQRGEYTKLWSGEPLRDLGKSIIEETKKRPDYRILRFLESGEEPEPRELFLILANVIRAEQDALLSAYNDGYLGGDWDEVDVEQLFRVSNWTDPDESDKEVKKRIDAYIRDMNAAHDALKNARKWSPQQLEMQQPVHFQLMRKMGYIEMRDGNPDTARYVVPQTQHSFRAFASRASGGVRLPGETWLAIANLRTVYIAAISAAVPEIAAARMAALLPRILVSQRTVAATLFIGEHFGGAMIDAAMEYYVNWREAKPGEEIKGVEWDRVILESVVLGSAAQFAGKAVDATFDAALKSLGSAMPKSALYRAMKDSPAFARGVDVYARAALGLASESAITTFYQMYVQGNMDPDAWKAVLFQAAVSRAVATGMHSARTPRVTWNQIRRFLPTEARRELEAKPQLTAEVVENVNRQLDDARRTLEDFQNRTEGQEITGKRLFRDLARGELNWRDLTKVIYPKMNDELQGAMESLRVMRERHFTAMKRKAIRRSIKDVNRFFDMLVRLENQKISDKEAFEKKLAELEAQREYELRLLRKKIIAPGSKDPTSDIDRSSESAWVRRHLRALYEADARFYNDGANDGDPPTSARAFDVNEYINVMPFIIESRQFMRAMARQNAEGFGDLRHARAMEALGLAAAMRYMDARKRRRFLGNKRRELQARIDAGQASADDMGRLEQQIVFANESLAKSEAELQAERQKVAARSPGLSDSEIDLLATDAVYERRMVEIAKKQFELSQMKYPYNDAALKLRSEILRDMAVALRNGIETYSGPVGLDIVVVRVQQAERADGKNMKDADRLEDRNFTLDGEVSDYTPTDIRSMINNQIMFIAEHVQGFNSGHEGFYETGRALGKYVQRAFLGMKIAGLDIAEVRSRPEYDPHRRLLEFAQALARAKDDPAALLNVLKDRSRTAPQSHESGMAELFWLMEKVLPGMDGMTGVVAERPADLALSAKEAHRLNPAYRRARLLALSRWRNELELVRENLGPDRAVTLVDAEIARAEAEIAWIDRRLAEMAELGAKYVAKDWKEVTRLQNAIDEARILVASLADHHHPLLGEIAAEKARAEERLDELIRPAPYSEMIEARLYETGTGYRRLSDRREHLYDRLEWLQKDLEKERKNAEKAKALMAIDLAGRWQCESDTVSNIAAALTANGEQVTMELDLPAPLSRAVKLSALRQWGAVKGIWQVFKDSELTAAGLVNALPTLDGRELQFTTASTSDPALKLNWSTLVCRRDSGGADPQAEEFTSVSYSPLVGEDKQGGWSVDVDGPSDVGPLKLEVRIRRGRKVFRERELEPGRYTLAVTVGGQTVTTPIEIKKGKLATIGLRPPALRVSGPDSEGLREVRLHPPGQRRKLLTYFRANTWVAVAPGKYDLELVTTYGSAWITGIEAGPGEALEVKTRTGALLVQAASGDGSVRIRPAAVDGAGEKIWTVTGSGRIGPLPPGAYDIAWEDGGKTRTRRVTVEAGQEHNVDLR